MQPMIIITFALALILKLLAKIGPKLYSYIHFGTFNLVKNRVKVFQFELLYSHVGHAKHMYACLEHTNN